MSFDGFYSDINIELFFLGLQHEGESILIILKCDNKIQHTLVIDSFIESDGTSPIIKALHDEGIKQIDTLVWSHPHDDHTKGFIKLLEEFDNNIKEILIPMGIDIEQSKYSAESKELLEKINEINKANVVNKKLTRIRPIVADTSIIRDKEIKLKKTTESKSILFNLYAVAPEGNLIRNRSLRQAYKHLNDFSIGLYYIVDDFVLFLSSDIENITINQLSEETLRQMITPNMLKLPHHGSDSSLKLFDFYNEKFINGEADAIEYIALTAYKSNKLPKGSVLNKYKDISKKIFKIDSVDTTSNVAILSFNVDILNKKIKPVKMVNYIEH